MSGNNRENLPTNTSPERRRSFPREGRWKEEDQNASFPIFGFTVKFKTLPIPQWKNLWGDIYTHCPVSWRKWTDDGKIRVIPFFLFKTISTSNKKYWIGRIYLSCVSQLINLLGERLKTTDVCLMFPWDYHKKWQFSYIKAKTEPQSDHNFIALSPWRKLLPHPPHQMMIWKGW